jgi:uncharacterized protein
MSSLLSKRVFWVALVIAMLGTMFAAHTVRQSSAVTPAGSLPSLPKPVGLVNDFANVLPAVCIARIERIAQEVKAKSKGEIAVVTLPSLAGRPVEEWGLRIGRAWGVRFAGAPDDPRTNTGVIVLVAPTERSSRVELGYGAEAFISDSLAGRILDEQMIPSFDRGDFGIGLLRGVNALALEFARRFDFVLEGAATECARGRWPPRAPGLQRVSAAGF